MRELPVPPDAATAQQAVELFRGWIVDGQFQCALFPTVWKNDPASWGSFFADAALHVANAIAEATGSDSKAVLKKIVEGFGDEISSSAGEREGGFLDG
ncbi:DUF5076 domain-containing protein [Limnoglobus roseus]|uniref:DUF5076 domain-containing protein n=1 Tax=Limnoglobus roseus TaxID=2598579 RepID=A0A5C1AQX1_9BACT|nr:DUF5076 domain-containing protein [Limnoglobus roseus]QEL19268.1 hypothetical protein PX52LOC_06330 [Limnoglobus roseus]